jgi:DnaJ-class molecular chaperone
MRAVICPVCNGSGKYNGLEQTNFEDVTCHGCDGKGWVEVHDEYPTYVPYPAYPPNGAGDWGCYYFPSW